jgi:hypothetical protein
VAEIYYSDEEMNFLISHKPGVRMVVRRTAFAGASRAEAVLAAHRYEGHSRITVTHGDVDSFVNLDDTRGQRAAAAIEYGTYRSAGIFALRSAF